MSKRRTSGNETAGPAGLLASNRSGPETIALSRRVVAVVSAWKPLVLEADTERVLFAYSDKACQEKANLYREDKA